MSIHALSQVSDSDIEEMFTYADADQDGFINWSEFQTMLNPPQTEQWTSSRITMTKMLG